MVRDATGQTLGYFLFFRPAGPDDRSPTGSPRMRCDRMGVKPAARAAASIAADQRGVTRSQPQIHDSPRNQLNSRSIGDGEARSSRQRE